MSTLRIPLRPGLVLFGVLGCAACGSVGEDSAQPINNAGDTGADTAVESGRDSDTGGESHSGETGDTGETADTAARACGTPASPMPLPWGDLVNLPDGTLLTEDVDGGGAPDLLHQLYGDRFGIALLRGETLRAGDTTDTSWFLTITAVDDLSNVIVGTSGDIDGSGERMVLVGEGAQQSGASQLVAWSPLEPAAPQAIYGFPDHRGGGTVWPAATPTGDLDGDGLSDLLITAYSSDVGYSRAFIFPASTLATGGVSSASGAWTTVIADGRAVYAPLPAPDLDGDGALDALIASDTPDGRTAHLLLPGDLGAGVVAVDNLDPMIALGPITQKGLFLDLAGDGAPWLFVTSVEGQGSGDAEVYGFDADSVAVAAQHRSPLDVAAAQVRIDGDHGDYLGGRLAPYSDAACETGLALSAHFRDEVRLIDAASLRAGGVVDSLSASRLSGEEWYGIVLQGGQDLDGDSTLDLAMSGLHDTDLDVFLSAGWP